MSFEIIVKRSARKELLALNKQTFERIAIAIDSLEDDPYPRGARKLRGMEQTWRIRVGNHRIVYVVDEDSKQVIVYRVRHRRDVYR